MLDIETYNQEWRDALISCGYSQYAAFQTSTFEAFGFPTEVVSESELLRYVDFFAGEELPERLDAGRFFRSSGLKTNFSLEEVSLLSRISQGVGELTEKQMGCRLRPHFNHLGAMGHARMVQSLASAFGQDKISVFEVGPGAGYAGAILGLLGHNYSSYEITQGYYLWQNRLLSYFFGNEFKDFCGIREPDLTELPRISHLPWWMYMKLHKNCPMRADVILSNANLGEMNRWCLKYVLRLSRLMLSGSPIGMIVYGNTGANHHSTDEIINMEFENAGFRRVLGDKMNAFGLADREIDQSMIQHLDKEVPIIGEDGSGKLYGPRDFIDFDKKDLHEEFSFFSFLADWPNFSSSEN